VVGALKIRRGGKFDLSGRTAIAHADAARKDSEKTIRHIVLGSSAIALSDTGARRLEEA
jgi:hypothetical protein